MFSDDSTDVDHNDFLSKDKTVYTIVTLINYDTYSSVNVYTLEDEIITFNSLQKYDYFANDISVSSDLKRVCVVTDIMRLNNQIYYLINKPRFSFANEGYYIYRFDQDFTFNNSVGNNNWNTPSNWNAGSLPLSSDNTIIPASQNPQITGNAFANNLTVSSPINLTSGNLNVAGNLNLGSSLTLNNNNLNLIGRNSQITNGNSSSNFPDTSTCPQVGA